MENLSLSISKMHCATCAQKIEKELSEAKGVLNVVVNFSNEQAVVTFDEQVTDEKKIIKIIEKIGYGAEINFTENEKQRERKRKIKKLALKLLIASIIALFILTSPFYRHLITFLSPQIIDFFLFLLTIIVTYIGAGKTLTKTFESFKKLKVYPITLNGFGISILLAYSLILIMFPGVNSELSRFTVLGTINLVSVVILSVEWIHISYEAQFKESYETLLEIKPKRARVVRHGTEMEIDINQVKIGDIIKIKPGETIPVDGIIIEGSTEINEMIILGTVEPVSKSFGDEVLTGTINSKNTITVKTTQVGENDTISQIISHIGDSKKHQSTKEINSYKFEKIFTVFILLSSILIIAFWTLLGAPIFVGIFCACSLLFISNPNLFTQGTIIPISFTIERMALAGIIFKGGKALEIANKIKHIVFDKTGIITKGVPEITNIVTKNGFNEKRFLILIGSLENASTHPFGEVILKYVKDQGITIKKPSEIKIIDGLGLIGIVDGEEVIAGNLKLMEKSNVQMNEDLVHKAEILSKNVKTPVYVARNRELVGIIGIADSIKNFSKDAVSILRKEDYDISLITGDNASIAESIAAELRIKSFAADLVQHEKSAYISEIQEKGVKVAFVGNGINDANVLAQSDLGMAVGTGNNISLEESDITLLSDNLMNVEKVLKVSKKTLQKTKKLFWLSLIYHFVTIVIISGIAYPKFNIIMHPALTPIIMGAYSAWMLNNISKIKKDTSFNF